MLKQYLVVVSLLMVGSVVSFRKEETVAGYSNYARQVVTANIKKEKKLGLLHSDTIQHNGASFLTVHFDTFNLRKGDRVVVRSPSNLERYEYVGLGRNQLGKFYSSAISGDVVVVEYYVSTPIRGNEDKTLGYSIDQYSHGFNSIARESICGQDDSKPSKCYNTNSDKAMYQQGKAVARLLMNGGGMCTGWLVGCDGYLLTNEHCINSQDTASNTDFEFMAESSDCTEECKTRLGCKGKVVATGAELIAFDADLDYALLKLKTDVDLSEYGYLQLRESGAVLNEEIYIPQHPQGWAKRLSKFIDDGSIGRVTSISKTTSCGSDQVAYMSDTQGGSSGSPVISLKDHKVVALHHCGGCDNTGVQVSKIFKHLGSKLPTCGGQTTPSPGTTRPTPSPTMGTPKPTQNPTQIPTQKPTPKPTNGPITCTWTWSGCQPTEYCRWSWSSFGCVRRS